MSKRIATVAAMCVVASCVLASLAPAQTNTNISPNGFKRPQCTYGADVMAYLGGWYLSFNPYARPRNALEWANPYCLRNARLDGNPSPGSIAIIRSSAFGHVAYIFSVDYARRQFLVIHTNWPSGSGFRKDLFEISRDGTLVRCITGGKIGRSYPLIGFLHRI